MFIVRQVLGGNDPPASPTGQSHAGYSTCIYPERPQTRAILVIIITSSSGRTPKGRKPKDVARGHLQRNTTANGRVIQANEPMFRLAAPLGAAKGLESVGSVLGASAVELAAWEVDEEAEIGPSVGLRVGDDVDSAGVLDCDDVEDVVCWLCDVVVVIFVIVVCVCFVVC